LEGIGRLSLSFNGFIQEAWVSSFAARKLPILRNGHRGKLPMTDLFDRVVGQFEVFAVGIDRPVK
jgi:hypothetical protein